MLKKLFCSCWGTILGEIGYFNYLIGNKSAVSLFEKACKYGTRSVNCLYSYSSILISQNRIDEALDKLNIAKRINKKPLMDKYISIDIGNCYWLLNKIDDAINKFLELELKYENLNFNSYTTLGFLFLLKSDFEKALFYTHKALDFNKDYAPAYDNLGQIYLKQNDLDLAREYFEKALEFNNNMVDSNYYLGIIFERKGKIQLAKKYFHQAYNCNINIYSSVSRESVEEKYLSYLPQDEDSDLK